MTESSLLPDPNWYRDGVIYECHVRAFADGNGDGIGDFAGLTERIDYFDELGVTAVWLLPFYPSPGRDDGYDIADFRSVNPAYGNLAGFRRFLRAAHSRGIRVITELVLNHTSDQHPWFQRARRAAPGSRWRDFYVWNDDPTRYGDARIIFSDTETSNWTWDPVAGAYYWHRFFHHQPDLNFDNPDVGDALLRVVDYWFDLGVDGLRLDAVPYLFEREGTICENLPETHAFLRRLRTHVDSNYEDRMLLAEANQWPQDAAAYFGDGDECHMNFHFPLMPRLFMALHTEQRFPIIDILEQTPELPDGCQWATFLRNHDELTLEMVTDEERDVMYRAFAHDPQMRLNLGIRRRLAPLLDGDRRKIELLQALLFSLPGTPVLYYGDELGMGDNVYLGDRDGVRTPMQWSPDRNAGFSSASPHRLYLPVITESRYHYATTNVATQMEDRTSQLWSTIQLIALRKRHVALGRGDIEFLEPDNPHALAFVRSVDGEAPFLVVANLSRLAQRVELDLSRWAGATVREVFGQTVFGTLDGTAWHLTLAPYGFFWFTIEAPVDEVGHEIDVSPPKLAGVWPRIVSDPSPEMRRAIEHYLTRARWYRGHGQGLRALTVSASVPCGEHTLLLVVKTTASNGSTDEYQLPVTLISVADVADDRSVIALVDDRWAIVDAASAVEGVADLVSVLRSRQRSRTQFPRLEATAVPALREALGDSSSITLSRRDQSNSGAVVGEAVLKIVRHVDDGESPEVELGNVLRRARFPHHAELLGWATLDRGSNSSDSATSTALIATRLVPHDDDAWGHALNEVGRFLERMPAGSTPPPPKDWFDPIDDDDLFDGDGLGAHALAAYDLGVRVAELHCVLAADPLLGSESWGELSRKALAQEFRTQLRRAVRELKPLRHRGPEDLAARIGEVVAGEQRLLDVLKLLRDQPLDGARIRIHGDLHLGQVLVSGTDHRIIDFEGEPLRSIGERRIKRTPLVDVAGMLRSYDYAAQTGVQIQAERGLAEPHLAAWADWWGAETGRHFLAGYVANPGVDALLPRDPGMRRLLLECCLINKAAYEIRYEIDHRPDWVQTPLRALERAIEERT
ncbi:MAG: maltose alpha-D-glucosyltransferase [Microthrixaceae bacterium]|nr:maltose alpha-D-glucosyltransferase [Microthrixaceae bacterium]